MEVAKFQISPLYKYVLEADECYRKANLEEKKKGKGGTLFYLSKYLDREKFKKKKPGADYDSNHEEGFFHF